MKKTFMVLLSLLVIATAVIIEGGNLSVLLCPTPMFMIFFGVLFSTIFTYKLSDVIGTFKDSFSKNTNPDKISQYKTELDTLRSIIKLTLYWSAATVILGLIFILSTLSTPAELGKSVAIVCLALLYGFGIIAVLLIPMESSLVKKINSIE